MNHTVNTIATLSQRNLVRSNGPLYRQLADILRHPINSGIFAVGSELPKEAAIAAHFDVSLITVRQALRDLEADGLIRKRSAKPAIVQARDRSVNLSWKFKNFADMAAFTEDTQLLVKSYRKENSALFQEHFGLGKGESGYCLRGTLVVGAQKKTQVTSYFPPIIGAKLRRENFSDVLIFRSVQRHLGLRLDVAHVTVRAEIADEAIAADLSVALGSPILSVEMLYQSVDQQNIEFTIARHPADLFSITYDAPNDLA